MTGWVMFALACAVLAVVLVLHHRELARMARFLRERQSQSNARLGLGLPCRGYADLVGEVNAQLDAAATERREAQVERRTFQSDLASLSHDIRTPLAGAKGYLQLAGGADDPAERERYTRMAAERLDVMEGLLDSLFAYTRTSDADAPLQCERVTVIPVLEGALAAAYPAFEERGWQPEVRMADPGLTVEADREALARIFANLVQNAFVHGSGAPRIVQEGATITFANPIEDASSIDATRVFDRFYRADTARRTPGTGLGLAVVATLCESMGIKVSAAVSDDLFSVSLTFNPF